MAFSSDEMCIDSITCDQETTRLYTSSRMKLHASDGSYLICNDCSSGLQVKVLDGKKDCCACRAISLLTDIRSHNSEKGAHRRYDVLAG
jgi:hypothetical protein